jgi:hypothetical protein
MKTRIKLPAFKNDQEISAFMETHDGFELVDQGLAEIVETPLFSQRSNSYIALDPETAKLLNELVNTGVCADFQEAVAKAVHTYVLAVLPDSYKLVQEE